MLKLNRQERKRVQESPNARCGEVVKREVIPKVGGSNTIVTVVIVLAIFAVIAAGGAVFFILSKGNGTGAGGAGKKTGGRASINK